MVARFGRLQDVSFANEAPGGSFTYTGTPADEGLDLVTHPDSTHRVSMGAGADRLYLQNLGRGEGTSYAGGRSLGDRVELTAGRGNAVLDMPGRRFDLVQRGVRGRTRIVGFDRAWGNRGRDRCRAEFRRGCELR